MTALILFRQWHVKIRGLKGSAGATHREDDRYGGQVQEEQRKTGGLPEGMEGPDAAGFLRANLSKWIPSLRGRDIEIDRAHRVYDGGRGSDRPRTLIFRVLRWHDRSEILKGARQAYPVKCAQNNVTLLFFPDFSPATAIRRKAFGPVLKKMTALGLQPFLIYRR